MAKMIEIRNFSLSYPGLENLYKDFSLDIEEGKITSILGNSGSGKTTILNGLANLIEYKGEIKNVSKNISYVFQNQILLPNLTVFNNIEFVLLNKIKDKNKRKEIIEKTLKAVDLFESINKYPYQLSVGMAQRVAIVRAFCYDADLILLDEPFRGLDIGIKSKLLDYFLLLWQEKLTTAVFVTHNIEEALILSDKIYVIGKKPVEIMADYDLNLPKNQRSMDNSDISKVYQEIFSLFKNDK